MERTIGEKFDYNGVTLKVVKRHQCCIGCYFDEEFISCCNEDIIGSCQSSKRTDKKNIIFKKVENHGKKDW